MEEMRKIAKPNRSVKKQIIAIERLRKIYPLQFMLNYFSISRSTYYTRLAAIKGRQICGRKRGYSYNCGDK